MLKNFFALLAFTLILASCTYEKAEDPTPEPVEEVCDTALITYNNTIQALVIANCSIDNDACHSANSEFPQDTYENMLLYFTPEQLLSAVTHDGNAEAMPQNGEKLDDCTINKIKAWINQGLTE